MDTPFVYLRATLEELQRRSPPTPVPSEFTPELLSGILSRDPNPDVDCMRVLAQIDEGYSNRVDLVFPSEADFAAATLPPFVDGVALTNLSSAIMLQNHVKIPVASVKQLILLSSHFWCLNYAPSLPAISLILLTVQPASVSFSTLAIIVDHTPPPKVHLITEPKRMAAVVETFGRLLGKYFPSTGKVFEGFDDWREVVRRDVFEELFLNLMPFPYVQMIFSHYLVKGLQMLFRFGLALISCHKKTLKSRSFKNAREWFDGMRDLSFGAAFTYSKLQSAALGKVWGTKQNKRVGFPGDKMLLGYMKKYELEGSVVLGGGGRPALSFMSALGPSHSANSASIISDAKQPLEAVSYPPLNLPENPDSIRLALPPAIRASLTSWVPQNLKGRSLKLIYNTNTDGRSLEGLYDACERNKSLGGQTIVLCEVLGAPDTVVGMYASDVWRPNSSVYGNGSCFVFALSGDNHKCFTWSPKNIGELSSDSFDENGLSLDATLECFQLSTAQFLAMGGNEGGGAALRLSDDLSKGSSERTLTFDNEILGEGEFEVGAVEVFGFMKMY